jgi:diguanylate cyclase (GGDEF)-like protein
LLPRISFSFDRVGSTCNDFRYLRLTFEFHVKSICLLDNPPNIAGKSILLRKFYDQTGKVPQEVSDQLAALMYRPHSHITVYVVSFAIAIPVFLERSHDVWIVAAAILGVGLNVFRLPVVHLFEQRLHQKKNTTVYWRLLHSMGCCFALTQSLLVARAFFLGDTVVTILAVMAVSTYTIGLIVRASAVPRLAIPHLLLLFIPLILVAACVPDKGFFAVAVFLSAGCLACVELSLKLHARLKGQLVAEHQLSLLARTDYLTGLANRAGLEAYAQLQGANQHAERYVLALIDLDGFKAVNDTHGHGVGDELLKEVAKRIATALRSRHFCARLGGDEFAIVFDRGTSLNDAVALGDRVVGGLGRAFKIGGNELQISASVGIATSDQSQSFNATLACADKALYQAKNGGRNQIQVFSAPARRAA